MENNIIIIGKMHRLSISDRTITIQNLNLNELNEWADSFCIWEDDIKSFKDAFEIFEKRKIVIEKATKEMNELNQKQGEEDKEEK